MGDLGRFGRFTLLEVLGEGGMGRVYKARIDGPDGFRKELALKVLRSDRDRDPATIGAALAKEARIGGLLRHPNLVDLYDFGVEDGSPWFSMELVPGRSLDRILAERGTIAPGRARALLAQIALGLAAIHELEVDGAPAGLVHRDLKPANVLVTPDDHVKLADFGISRGSHALTATETDSLRGTPAYMSPEQARNTPLDARSDLFAFGMIGFELVTGRRFLTGGSVFEVMFGLLQVEQRQDELRALDATAPGLGSLLADCLREHPEDRPASARDVRDRLLEPPSGSFGDLAGATTLQAPSPTPPTGNLRAGPDTFVGRDAELAALRDALTAPRRVVSLLGPGGTGKTRLAQELGLGVRDAYPGGVWFVDLTEARTSDGVCAAVAHALDVPLRHGSAADQIAAALEGRPPLLLLLDNFEQVQRFAPDTVGAWARRCADSRFVVTTRQRLQLGAEQVVRVGPLRGPLTDDTTDLADLPAVQLFLDRARRCRPGFELDDDNAPHIAHLVRALDGIPLAIELAAARLRVLSVERLLQRLPRRFDLLSTGRTDVTGRQATLRATIDWSWNLLEPWEQLGLAQASVFRGGFTVDAAEAVLDLSAHPDAPWVLDVVQALEDKSLLRSVTAESGDVRFLHYESIREFAAEKLAESGDAERAARRHVAHFSAFGRPEAVESLFRKGASVRRRRLSEDLENLVLAAERGLEHDLADDAADGALVVAELLSTVGPLPIPIRLLGRVLDRPDTSVVQRIRALLARGSLRSLRGDYPPAEADLLEAERLAADHGESLLEGWAWAERGRLNLNSPDVGHSDLLERARARFEELGDTRREGWILCSIAVRDAVAGRFQEARSGNEQALLKLRRTGDRMSSLVALGNLAIAYKELGLNVLQQATLNEALRLARELGALRYEAVVLVNLGVYQQGMGRLQAAEETYTQALELARRIGFAASETTALGNLGDVLKDQGRLEAAEPWLLEGIAHSRATNNVRHLAGQLNDLSQILLGMDRLDEADAAISEAEELAPSMGHPRHIGEAAINRAALHRLRGEYDDAEPILDEADRVLRVLPETRFHLTGRLERLELELARGRGDEARALAEALDSDVRDVHDPLLVAHLLASRGAAVVMTGGDAPAVAAELSEILDGIELAPESSLRHALADLRRGAPPTQP